MSKAGKDVMDMVVQNGCFSADALISNFQGTGAEKTRLTIQRALEALEANGIITINDTDIWPNYYIPDPPYKGLKEMMSGA